MSRFLSIGIVLLPVILAGCDSNEIRQEEGYLYTAYESENEDQVVATGLLHLQFESSERGEGFNDIEGTWSLSSSEGDDAPCHWTGEGQLRGEVAVSSGEADIDLNPGVADNNLWLDGRFEDVRFEGTWSVSTIQGVVCSGPFEAVVQ